MKWDFLFSIFSKLIEWFMALYIRPSIKVIQFDIEGNCDGKQNVSFAALISNNTSKPFSISQKFLIFYDGKTEISRVEVTRYEIQKKKDVFDELTIFDPVDDIITLQPGETKEIKTFGNRINGDKVDKVIFSYFTGRKTCTFRVKLSKRKSAKNTCEDEKLDGLEKKVLRDKINKKVVALNKNIGAVTWISTVTIAVIATVLKFMWYVFQRGKLTYWKIDSTAITIVDDITLYSVFFMFILGIVIIVIMFVPFMIVKSKKKIIRKVIDFIILILFFSLIIGKKTGMHNYINENGVSGIIASGIVLLISFICFFSPSWTVGMALLPSKDKKEEDKKISINQIVVRILLYLIVMTGAIYYSGYESAKAQKEFRITKDGYAIIYETKDYYYLAEYNTGNHSVNKEYQIMVKKEYIEYSYIIK